MPLLSCAFAITAVTVIYLFWRSYISVLLQRRRVQRERVTHLLWVMADLDEARIVARWNQVDSPLDVA